MSLGDLWYYASGGPGPPPGLSQTITMAGAIATATAGVVMVTQEGVVYPRLEATRRLRPNAHVVERVIDGSMRRQWQDELNETGSASMVIPNEFADSTVINEGDVIVFADDGWATFGWLVKEIERVQIARSEEIDQVTTFSGVGLLGLLAEALVYPQRGLHRKPIPRDDDRYFSWFSPDYEAQWFWPNAHVIATYGELAGGDSYWRSLPAEWPDPDAAWIWAPSGSTEWAPSGDCYFAGEFTVPEGVTHISLFFACDNISKVYFDGDLYGEAEWAMEDTYAYEDFIEVSPGEHYLAAWVQNAPEEPEFAGTFTHNPAGMICSVYPANEEAITGPPLYRSGGDWRVCAYPATPPGMTPGMAMWHLIFEAGSIEAMGISGRGTLAGLTITWTDEVDSDGNPWPIVGDISTKVGTDILTFFKELAVTYIDFAMDPANFRLHAWVKGMRGANKTGIDGSTGDVELYPVIDPNDPWSGNLAGLTFRRAD